MYISCAQPREGGSGGRTLFRPKCVHFAQNRKHVFFDAMLQTAGLKSFITFMQKESTTQELLISESDIVANFSQQPVIITFHWTFKRLIQPRLPPISLVDLTPPPVSVFPVTLLSTFPTQFKPIFLSIRNAPYSH